MQSVNADNSDRPTQRRTLAALAAFALALALVQRFPSFFKQHGEGDEIVYLTLAREMNWNLSHYTTMDDPRVRRYPYSIYRQELFHHPPLYPLLLKVGEALFFAPVAFGLVVGNGVLLLMFYYAMRWLEMIEAPLAVSAVVFAALASCPLLLFSTTRLHHDGLFGMLVACAVVAQMGTHDEPSLWRAITAAGLWIFAFNMRYTALAMLPLPLVIFAYHHFRRKNMQSEGVRAGHRRRRSRALNWKAVAVLASLVLALGLQHYARILSTYGTLVPGEIIVADEGVEKFSPFLASVFDRTRLSVVYLLLTIFPIGLMLLCPQTYGALWQCFRRSEWLAVMVLAGAYCSLVIFVFAFQQVRYFAAAMPCLCLGLPLIFDLRLIGRYRWLSFALGAASLLLMITTGFLNGVLAESVVAEPVPSLFFFIPPLGPQA